MSTPSPFHVAQQASNNIGNAFSRVKDENAIERILADAMSTDDPSVVQNSIGKILSSVSPERQGLALKYLENTYNRVQEKQKLDREQEAAKKFGVDANLSPALQTAVYKENQKNQRIAGANDVFNQASAAPITMPQTNEPTTPSIQPKNNASRRQQLLALTGHPDREVSERAKAELRVLETEEKNDRADLREKRKETQKLREDIAGKAAIAQQGIQEKEHLIDLINTGKINDPTVAILLNAVPMKLGERFLSEETVQYKAGLINGYRDLRNIFTGATRVKEIELLEDKVADLYLTDDQKKGILKSSLQTLQYEIIREDVAAEIENKFPNLGVLGFSKKVNELAKPKLEALANRVIDEQKSFIKDAENRKKIPLDYDDPEGRQILTQILKEAGGDRVKAREIAKKKGYIIGK